LEEWFGASSADTMEERFGASTADTVEERFGTSTADTVERIGSGTADPLVRTENNAG
jgi:hypothetical protein